MNMKNIMYGVITIVVIVAGSIFTWGEIQDQKMQQTTIELKQKQEANKEELEKEEKEKEEIKIQSEEEYVSNLTTYFNSMNENYFKASKISGNLSIEEEHQIIDQVISDAENITALQAPDKYRTQQNQISDRVKDIRATALTAKEEEDAVLMSLKLFENPEAVMNDFLTIKDIIDKITTPGQIDPELEEIGLDWSISSTNVVTPSSDIIESSIDGDFEGWEGETIFKLTNGQIWQQTSYSYTYHYAYSPDVIIYSTSNGYKLKVDGVDEEIFVERIK